MQDQKKIYQNLSLLTVAFSMVVIGNVLIFTGTAVTTREFAPEGFSTSPFFLMILGAICSTWPLSMFMKRHGRRLGLQLGAFAGAIGGVIAAIAVEEQSFPVMLLAYFIIGIHYSAVPYYRFAGVDVAGPALVNRGLAFVLSGGILASLIGPTLTDWSKDVLETPFVGCYLLMSLVMTLAIVTLSQLVVPESQERELQEPVVMQEGPHSRDLPERSLGEIAASPVFQLAIFVGVSAYGLMVLLMVSAPLAVQDCGYPFGDISSMLQFHILGMYVPSLFSGFVLDKIGKLPVMTLGTLLCFLTVALAQMGQDRWMFFVSQAILGVGWNWMYLGASSLLTESYRPSEQAKVQALNEFSTMGLVALANIAAGVLYYQLGWVKMNELATAVVLSVLAVQLFLSWKIKRLAVRQVQPA